MAKKTMRQLSVLASSQLTPHMQRIVLTGDALATFPEASESGYIKFLFTRQGDAITRESQVATLLPDKPVMRTYTVRAFDAVRRLLTVDFALHSDSHGPASQWAEKACIGDEVVIVGPGPVKLVDNAADWVLIAGDMTALPAISCNLEQLPADAKGYAVIEITAPEDKQSIAIPEGVEVKWVISDSHSDQEAFLNTVFDLDWMDGEPYVWCACEFETMKRLRKHFKLTRPVSKQSLYISSYWKRGISEDQHKIVKQHDATAQDS